MKIREKHCIGLPKESWVYLQMRSHTERCGTKNLDRCKERMERIFADHLVNGYRRYKDGDLGGCNGPIENAWEQGRWTSWSCETVKQMLNEQGLPWVPMDDTKVIELGL